MTTTSMNTSIEEGMVNSNNYLYFRFKGDFTEQEAVEGINLWKEMALKTGKKQSYIWDCTEMTGYEPMARATWQKAIKELKNTIEKIWLITNSSLISAGAKMISIFTSYEIQVVKSINEIK